MNVQVNIGSNSSGSYKDVNIKFPQPFGEIPSDIPDTIIVVASVVLENTSYPDRYSVDVANVTKQGFTARVTRLDGDKGWGMNLSLNYIATTCTIFSK